MSVEVTTKKIRCAIYTRKSREEGLEQNFNSLHAQRFAAENYIASQIHEGWVLNPEHYDDGAYSGGNTDRPAFQRMLKDIADGKIDCVVVYKVERMCRSNADFVGIIETFDRHNVNFVSVTESFNTGTASGRLMLGMLINFAQYERELCSERIRDKFANSKKKGIWMGGNLPFGYNLKDRNLLINDEEARVIASIYNQFIKTESITQVTRNLNEAGITTKKWVSKNGTIHKGNKFGKNTVERILKNPLYIGKVTHKNSVYPGQHEAIISEEVFNLVQVIFAKDRKEKVFLPISRISSPPLLKSVINCGCCGCAMSPTYTSKDNKKYRYYVCSRKLRSGEKGCPVGSIGASQLEELVKNQILKILKKPEIMVHTMNAALDDAAENDIISYFQNIEKIWDELFPVEQVRIINLLVKQMIVCEDRVDLKIFKKGLVSLASEMNQVNSKTEEVPNPDIDDETIEISFPVKFRKKKGYVTLILANESDDAQQDKISENHNEKLISAFSTAYRWQQMIKNKEVESLSEIAKIERTDKAYIAKIFKLNYVAPDIIRAILDGAQPGHLKLRDFTHTAIPDLWEEQREFYGFK